MRIVWGLVVALALLTINLALPAAPGSPYQVEAMAEGFDHMTLDEVRVKPPSSWQVVDPMQLSFLAEGGREVWLHVKIPPNFTGETWIAEIAATYVRQLDLFVVDSDQTESTAQLGMDRPLSSRPYGVNHIFAFKPSGSEDQHLYIRAYTEINAYLPLRISSEAEYHTDSVVRNILLGLMIGMFFGIVLYNLFVCISLRDRVYAYYCAYEIGIGFFGMMLNGQLHLLFPSLATHYALDIRVLALTLVVVGIAFGLFIQEFAALKHNDAAANRLVLPFIGLLLIMTIPIMLMPLHVIVTAVIISLSLGVMALIFGIAFRAKTRREFYLLLSFIGLGTCAFITLGTDLHVLRASKISEHMLYIGGIWQALFLSMALAERISAMENERKAIIRTLKGEGPASDLNNLLGTTFNRTHSLNEMNVSIMFIDIVGFSQLADILGSHKIFQHLARLMQDITAIVKDCNGNVDRSLGDGVLCIFGYERGGVRFRHHAQDAFAAAQRIQEDIVARFQKKPVNGEHVMPVRIGIHVANVLLGDLGGTNRIDFTMIGSGVNFASRLETACSPFKIMLSEECVSHLQRNALDDPGFAEILVAVKHEKRLVKAYEYDPFSTIPERLEIVEKLHLNQLSRKAEDSRHVIIRGVPVHLTCELATFNLLDFSNRGFRVMSDVYVGRNASLEVELQTFDEATNTALADLLLNKFYIEVRWSRKTRTGAYEHGLRIAGLNEVQREKVFNLVAKLYSPADTALDEQDVESKAG